MSNQICYVMILSIAKDWHFSKGFSLQLECQKAEVNTFSKRCKKPVLLLLTLVLISDLQSTIPLTRLIDSSMKSENRPAIKELKGIA